jgi:hypothetical protein
MLAEGTDMHLRAKLVGIATVVVGLTLLGTLVEAMPASARTPTQSVKVVGSGLLFCDSFTGKITLHPAWSNSGTGDVTAKFSLSANGGSPPCSLPSGGAPVPTKVTGSGVFTFENGTCVASDPDRIPIISASLNMKYRVDIAPSALVFDPSLSPGISSEGNLDIIGGAIGSYPQVDGDAELAALAVPHGNCTSGIKTFTFDSMSETGLQI